MKQKRNLVPEIKRVVESMGSPVDISHVARRLGIHWYTIYKAVADLVLTELLSKHKEILFSLPIIPLKTPRGIILLAKGSLPSEIQRKPK